MNDLNNALINYHALKMTGRIDVLVNNAGFGDTDMSLSSENLMEGYDKVMGLNLKSAIRMTQLCVPHLEKGKGFSNIINISSIAAIRPVSETMCNIFPIFNFFVKTVRFSVQLLKSSTRHVHTLFG